MADPMSLGQLFYKSPVNVDNLHKIFLQTVPFLIRSKLQVPVTLEKSSRFNRRWEVVLDNTGAYVDDLGQRVAVKRRCDQGSLGEVNDVHWAAYNLACFVFTTSHYKTTSRRDQWDCDLRHGNLDLIRRHWVSDVGKLAVEKLRLIVDQADIMKGMTIPPAQTLCRYPALLQEPNAIRLVVLLAAADRHGEIACRLCNIRLDERCTAKYEALSYVWGNPSNQRTILVDNKPFQVTGNLESALRNLRYPDRPRVLWVDSICINQSDNKEKTIQVQQMGHVYRNAQKVIVWLGPESEDSNHAFGVLEQLPLFDLKKQLSRLDLMNNTPGDTRALLPLYPGSLETVYRLLERPWFKRIWCVPEFILAKNAIFQCGQSTLPSHYFTSLVYSENSTTAVFMYHRMYTEMCGMDRMVRCLRSMISFHKSNWGRHLRDKQVVLKLLIKFYEWKSSDARDKIFAFYSLVPPENPDRCILKPNYESNVAKVYTEVALHFIRKYRNLDILSIATWPGIDFFREPEILRGLPSWVPDWRHGQWFGTSWDYRSIAFDCIGSELLSFDEMFNASLNLEATPIEIRNHSQTLVLDGFNVDEIDSIGDIFLGYPRATKEQCNATICQWEEIGGLPGKHCYQYSGQPVHEAFWRTLLMDCQFKRTSEKEFMGRSRMPHDNAKVDGSTYFPRCPRDLLQGVEGIIHRSFVNGRRFFKTRRGLFGLAPAAATKGDHVMVLFGGKAPFILTNIVETDLYHLVGESYVHGIMHGEAIHQPRTERFQHLKVETFQID